MRKTAIKRRSLYVLFALCCLLGWQPQALGQVFGNGANGFPQAVAFAQSQTNAGRVPREEIQPPRSSDILPSPLEDNRPLDLRASSWMTVPPPPVRLFKKHDIISIRVDEIARVRADGASQSRKNSLYDALLQDWLRLDGLAIKPARQTEGDPRVRTALNQLYRADASLEMRESLSMNIAAEIVDMLPNGNLVLEAHKTIWVNDNAWDTSLTGICRAQDIGPDNVILTRDILDLQINKKDRGRLQDGYRRGWFTRLFETFQPF